LLIGGAAVAADFHVAPNGNDANPGTAAKPFATLETARDKARTTPGPHTILLAPGRYFHSGAIVLDDRDSGLTLRGAQTGAVAELYGGLPVTGWERWKGNVWRAPVPKGQRFFNLIVDGRPATMAQTPNAGSGFGGGAANHGNETVQVPAEWMDYDYADAQVSCFIGGNWYGEVREVLDPKPNGDKNLRIDPGSGMFGGMNERFFLRGVLDFLDEPGEWCLKHQEGYLYYWPPSGAPDKHLIVRPTSQRLLEIHGRTPLTPAKNVRIENLSLIGSDFSLRWYICQADEANRDGKNNATPEPLQQGLLFAENVDGLHLTGCRILAAGHSGVWLNKFARRSVVENCLISGAGFSGIYANGFMPGEGDFASGQESDVNREHRIENNFIYDCGKYVGAGCGMLFYQSGRNRIAHNEIGHMPRYGIAFKGVRWGVMPRKLYGHEVTFDNYLNYIHTRKNEVVGNEIYSVCRNSFDYGAIEGWGTGSGNLWANNDLHDLDQVLNWAGWAHVLFPDDACHLLTIRDNIIHHCSGGASTGAIMLKNIGQVVENNLVMDCDIGRLITFQPYIEPSWDVTVRHNIFATDGTESRYGVINDDSLNGKAPADGVVPPGSSGFKEINHNWITPANPADPNLLARHKMDLNSTFGPAPVRRLKPDWNLTAADYAIAPRPAWFKPIDTSKMGLRPDFPFDKITFTRRQATDKIQAEDYDRKRDLRTTGGFGIYHLVPGAWAKYANIGFPAGLTKAVFALTAADSSEATFIRHYGNTVAEAVPFKGDASVETITRWEISNLFTRPGLTSDALFDEKLAPEQDITAGNWKPYLAPVTTRAGVTSVPGVVDLDTANGEEAKDACAYARASIYATTARTNATLSITSTGGSKVWLNGELVLSNPSAGTYSETPKGTIRAGWNTILVKTCQGKAPGNLSFTFGIVASSCGHIVTLPGLPTEDRVSAADGSLVELRLDSPEGELIGAVPAGQSECPIKPVTGIHNLYLVSPRNTCKEVDWFRME
jgi:hypothetical protein